MEGKDFLSAIQEISMKLDSIIENVGISRITPYEGDPKPFRAWINEVEKYALLEKVPKERLNIIAFKTSRGAASDFILRCLKSNANVKWETLKEELSSRFSDVINKQHAFILLRNIKQRRNEKVQSYTERLLSLAEHAGSISDMHLVEYFIDGLYSDRVTLKVMRDNPTTMADAIRSARQ